MPPKPSRRSARERLARLASMLREQLDDALHARSRRSLAATALGLSALAFAGLQAALALTAAGTVTVTVTPSDDTYASSAHPDTIEGWLSTMRVDGSPDRVGYVKFTVTGISGTPSRVTLRFYATTDGAPGPDVHAVTDTSWSEETLTGRNAPPFAAATLASAPSVSAGAWIALDVTQAVSGNGIYSFALTTAAKHSFQLATKEYGSAFAPQLVLEVPGSAGTTTGGTTGGTTTGGTTGGTTTGGTTTTTPPTTTTTPPSTTSPTSLTPPLRGAFYYPWYPETWTVGGAYPHFTPALGYYDSSAGSVVDQHVRALDYARVNVAIASWWGAGSHSESTRIPLLLDRTAALGSPLRWSVYYEKEGSGNPTVTEIQSDLAYLKANYAGTSTWAYVQGKPVIFVWNANDSTCEVADRWKQAAAGQWYVVLKVFSGYRTCASQPDSWHQYAPAVARDAQSGYSFSVSPGFWKANETTPRLARDPSRWAQDVRDMVASNAPWQLVTTFNEWGEGTAVEAAQDWSSSSGYGTYLDVLHDNGQASGGGGDTTPPTQPGTLTVASSTQTGVSLGWGASTDDVAVTGYNVYVDGAKSGSTASTSYTVTGLTCGTGYTFSVRAYDAAGNLSTAATKAGSTSACSPTGGSDPVVAAAGDIACDPADGNFNGGLGTSGSCRQKAVSDLLLDANLAAVLTLGDNQYEDNAYAKYLQSFDPSWGRVKGLIRPGIGNHEYLTAGAAGYFQYFGAAAGDPAKGYYSYDVGTWHLIALNSNCSQVGGCGAGSPQEQWLKTDLAAHPNACVLAYWHHPRWSSGQHGNNSSYGAFWQDLYNAGAELVLNGHDHDYERFAPQSPAGALDAARGIREFVVGTGGKNHYGFVSVQPNSEARNSDTYGVLQLTLRPNGYDWKFVPEAGKTFTDSGSGSCH